jgi:hypothetical protein
LVLLLGFQYKFLYPKISLFIKGENEMKPIITTLAAVMLLATALPAQAANGTAPDGGCQPGADNNIVEGW